MSLSARAWQDVNRQQPYRKDKCLSSIRFILLLILAIYVWFDYGKRDVRMTTYSVCIFFNYYVEKLALRLPY